MQYRGFILVNEYAGERVGDIPALCGQEQATEGNSSQANRQDKPGTALNVYTEKFNGINLLSTLLAMSLCLL